MVVDSSQVMPIQAMALTCSNYNRPATHRLLHARLRLRLDLHLREHSSFAPNMARMLARRFALVVCLKARLSRINSHHI
jgi:hypothetical protein